MFSKIKTKLNTNVSKVITATGVTVILLNSPRAMAAADYMQQIGATVGTGLTLALNAVSALVFIVMVWAILTKFSEASRGRAGWGEVFLPFIVGAVVLAFLAVITPDATTAITTLGTAG